MLQSVQNDSYDHHAAIYYLLKDRLTNSRNSATVSQAKNHQVHQNPHNQSQEQKRRPSSIAEQVSLTGHYIVQGDNNFQSLRDYSAPRTTMPSVPHHHPQHQHQQAMMHAANVEQSQPQSQEVMSSGGMLASEYECWTCGGPILENTTSTTTCVKCARLRTRRRAFA